MYQILIVHHHHQLQDSPLVGLGLPVVAAWGLIDGFFIIIIGAVQRACEQMELRVL